jgi:hypothetical protein
MIGIVINTLNPAGPLYFPHSQAAAKVTNVMDFSNREFAFGTGFRWAAQRLWIGEEDRKML